MWGIIFLIVAIYCGIKWFVRYLDMMALLWYLDISGIEYSEETFKECLENVIKKTFHIK